jgi:hypothetical protein
MALGSRHGTIVLDQEKVSWEGNDKVFRRASIPTIYFSKDSISKMR